MEEIDILNNSSTKLIINFYNIEINL